MLQHLDDSHLADVTNLAGDTYLLVSGERSESFMPGDFAALFALEAPAMVEELAGVLHTLTHGQWTVSEALPSVLTIPWDDVDAQPNVRHVAVMVGSGDFRRTPLVQIGEGAYPCSLVLADGGVRILRRF